MTTARSAERRSTMFVTRRVVDQPMNTMGSFLWSMRLEHTADCSTVYSTDDENALCSLPLPHARCIQPRKPPHHISHHPLTSRSILILSAYLHIGFPSSLFPSDVPTKQCTHLSPMRATCPNPSHPPSLHHQNNIWQAVQVTNILT